MNYIINKLEAVIATDKCRPLCEIMYETGLEPEEIEEAIKASEKFSYFKFKPGAGHEFINVRLGSHVVNKKDTDYVYRDFPANYLMQEVSQKMYEFLKSKGFKVSSCDNGYSNGYIYYVYGIRKQILSAIKEMKFHTKNKSTLNAIERRIQLLAA